MSASALIASGVLSVRAWGDAPRMHCLLQAQAILLHMPWRIAVNNVLDVAVDWTALLFVWSLRWGQQQGRY